MDRARERVSGAVHALFWPDLFILGGAVSERFDEFAPLLHSRGADPPGALRRPGRSDRRGARRRGATVERFYMPWSFRSKLPDVGTTIFTVMSRARRELGALNLGQGFPDYRHRSAPDGAGHRSHARGHNQYAPMEGVIELRAADRAEARGDATA